MNKLHKQASPPSNDGVRQLAAEQIAALAPIIHAHTMHVWRGLGRHTPAQAAIVKILSHHSLPQVSLQHVLGISAPTLSKQIDSLEGEGLVTRTVDTEDRRRATVTLTEQGRMLADQAKQQEITEIATLISTLSEEETACVSKAVGLIASLYDARSSHRKCRFDKHHSPSSTCSERTPS